MCVIAVAMLSGCVLDPIVLDDRRCPCLDGWVCDEMRDRCVRPDAAGADAGSGETP